MSLTKVSYSMIDGAPVNVLDFGAVGDGTTDDTSAIQAAIDTGKSVYFPSGTYKLTATLVISSSTVKFRRFFGDSKSNSIIKQVTAGQGFMAYTSSTNYIAIDMNDLGFEGDNTTGAGLSFSKLYHSNWTNLDIICGGAAVVVSAAFSVTFNRVDVSSYNSHGFSVVGENSVLFIQCYPGTILTASYAGFNIEGKATFISCNCLDSGYIGYRFVGTTGQFTLIGCNIEDFKTYGIKSECGNLALNLERCNFLPPSATTAPSGYQCSIWVNYSNQPINIIGCGISSKGATRNLATEIVVDSSDADLQMMVFGSATNFDTATVASISHALPQWQVSNPAYAIYAAAIPNLSVTNRLFMPALPVYANNAAALAGGLNPGSTYRTNGNPDTICVVH